MKSEKKVAPARPKNDGWMEIKENRITLRMLVAKVPDELLATAVHVLSQIPTFGSDILDPFWRDANEAMVDAVRRAGGLMGIQVKNFSAPSLDLQDTTKDWLWESLQRLKT